MAAAPTTKNWRMLENHRKAGPHLLVGGLVHLPNTEHAPRLAEAKPGSNPKILLLDLTVAPSGQPGIGVPCWKQASFEKDVQHGQYGAMEVRWDGKSIGKATVEDDMQCSARLLHLTQQANAAHPVPTSRKPPPGKAKSAAKKAATKKPAAKKSAGKKTASAKKRTAKASAAKTRPAKKGAGKKRTAPRKGAKKAASRRPAARRKTAKKTSARRRR